MRPVVSGGPRGGYEAALAGVWSSLAGALSQLEELAADPGERLDDEAAATLGRLQYVLHRAAELAAALAGARDATAEFAEVLENGGATVAEALLPEWRGALFRVRLARLRAATPKPLPTEVEPEAEPRTRGSALAATVLAISGALVFAVGATVDLWPVWALGLALFASGFLAYSPRP